MDGDKNNVTRRESKRWVAPKTSYDGDDWGNEYDDYDSYAEEADLADVPPDSLGYDTLGSGATNSGLTSRNNSKHVENLALDAIAEEERPLPLSAPDAHLTQIEVSEPGESSLQHEQPHDSLPTEQPAPEDDDSSIQDIYGFYENRYSQNNPYGTMLSTNGDSTNGINNDYSDSTASLSTGRHSVESNTLDMYRSSVDYQSDLNKVPEATEASSYSDELPQIAHLQINKHSRNTSLETTTQGEESSSASRTLADQNEPPLPTPHMVADSGDVSRFSQVDPDIAELYMGSSEYLTRPLSTYQVPLQNRDFSDQSIREILTPVLDAGNFEATDEAPSVPSLLVTSASPEQERAGHKKSGSLFEAVESQSTATNESPSSERVASFGENSPTDFAAAKDVASIHTGERDLSYVDGPSEMDAHSSESGSESDSDTPLKQEAETKNEGDGASEEPFILPSERNRHQNKAAVEEPAIEKPLEIAQAHTDGGTNLGDFQSGITLSGQDSRQESTALPEASSQKTLDDVGNSDMAVSDNAFNDMADDLSESVQGSYHELDHEKHVRGTSELSGISSGTGATATSINSPVARDSASTQSNDRSATDIESRGVPGTPDVSAQEQGFKAPHTQSAASDLSEKPVNQIAAKVKRPPQVDFAALFNQSDLSSEARNRQIQQLRIREMEYSTGLETWIMATMDTIAKDMQIYTDGVPPSGDLHTLEIPATAKVTNAVQSSATNTKEKLGKELGKVSTKSKSFFAKVIR